MNDKKLTGLDSGACLATINQPTEIVDKIFAFLKKKEGILLLTGNPGCGKTYICKAIYNDWLKREYGCSFFYINRFYSEVRSAIERKWDCSYMVETIADRDWVILDDWGATALTEWQLEIITDFINLRHENRKPLIITTNFQEKDILALSPRLHSRFKDRNNCIIDVSGVDKRSN